MKDRTKAAPGRGAVVRVLAVLAMSAPAASLAGDGPASGAAAKCDPCTLKFAWTWGFGHGRLDGNYVTGTAVIGDVRRVGPVVATKSAVLLQAEWGDRGSSVSAGLPLIFIKVGEVGGLLPLGAGGAVKLTHVWTRTSSAFAGQRYLGPAFELALLGHVRVAYLFAIGSDRARPARDRVEWSFGAGF